MPIIGIFDWSLYSTSLSQNDLEVSTHGNDYGQTGSNAYNPSVPTWTGVDFTFNGGAPTAIEINDDDGLFQDAYVETGGAQTLAQDVTINGVDFFAGDVVQNEFSLLDANGLEVWVVRINNINVGFAYPQGSEPVMNDVFNANDTRDGDGADSLDQTTPSEEAYTEILCFAFGTRIAAETGLVPAEELRPGDRVWTLDHGLQPVRWHHHSFHQWSRAPDKNKPVLFAAGALGMGLPTRDLVVSPQHRMLMPTPNGPRGMLCPAKAMTCLPGVRQMRGRRSADLVHILFDRHEVVLAEGAPSETFFPGPMAMAGFTDSTRCEVAQIVARNMGAPGQCLKPARGFLRVQAVRSLLARMGGCCTADSLAAAGYVPPGHNVLKAA